MIGRLRFILGKPKAFLGRYVFRLAKRRKWLSILYYSFFSRAFHYELLSTVAALHKYNERLQSKDERSALLRRNIHRLEKGLLMRPRRNTFAGNYIAQTVDVFLRRVELAGHDEKDELDWASSVLHQYFANVDDSDASVVVTRERFFSAVTKFESKFEEKKFSPYLRDLNSVPPVEYEALLSLAKRRRSVRWYLPKKVDQSLIEKAVSVATQSPSACNRQPFEFRVFNEADLVKKVARVAPGTAGFVENIPGVAVVVGRLDSYFSERDRHLIYIDSSLAAMSFMMAMESLGLSTCPLNWPDSEELEKKLSKVIGLELYERAIMMISFGYPDPTGKVAYSQKKSPQELCIFNQLRADKESKEKLARVKRVSEKRSEAQA